MLCSVFTPYFEEDVLYSQKQLIKENDDGITMLYYLRTIVPGWSPLYGFSETTQIIGSLKLATCYLLLLPMHRHLSANLSLICKLLLMDFWKSLTAHCMLDCCPWVLLQLHEPQNPGS